LFNSYIPDIRRRTTEWLGTSVSSPKQQVVHYLQVEFAKKHSRVFAPILRCYLDFIRSSALQKLPRTRELPRENWLAKLVNFASAAGRNGKRGDDGSGEICELAH